MVTAVQVLALMLSVATPGETTQSRVEIPHCDAACQRRPACAEWPQKAVCAPPRYDARLKAWTRAESRSEGLKRYESIARAIARTANNPPSTWTWPAEDLAVGLVVISRHESAFWRSVQTGAVRGPAGEVCLVQINSGTGYTQAERERMVGLDDASLDHCLFAGSDLLARARNGCKVSGPNWFHAAIASYGSGRSCRGAWARGRAWMFYALSRKLTKLQKQTPPRPKARPVDRDCLLRKVTK